MPTPDVRLRRYAVFAAAHVVAVAAVIALPLGGWALWLLLVTAVPFLFSWGHYHVDLARNEALDESSRTRWRGLFYLMPWSMAVYWWIHVRPRPSLA